MLAPEAAQIEGVGVMDHGIRGVGHAPVRVPQAVA
jgi:hypothetical protein